MKKTVHMMIGLPGSGKSTRAKTLTGTYICPDEIREELCEGDRSDQSKNAEVWGLAYGRMSEALRNGEDVVFDATCTTKKTRKRLMAISLMNNAKVIGHLVMPNLDLVYERNSNRRWKVPLEVIDRMVRQFEMPCKTEGFDRIIIYNT